MSKGFHTTRFMRIAGVCALLLVLLLLQAAEAAAAPIARREVLPNGLVLLHAERKTLPIVKVVVAVRAGSIMESYEKAGLANLTADLLKEGTRRRSSKEISDAIEFVGGSLGSSGGADYMTITLSVLKKDLDLGFDLLSDIILNPSFSDEEVARRKALIRSSIIQQKEEPGIVASKAFMRAVFGDNPYGWPPEGTEDSVPRITRKDIVDFHRTYYVPNNAIMSVAGDVGSEELKGLIAKYFRGWDRKDVPAPHVPVPPASDKPTVIAINKEITQANVILGHAGLRRDNPDYYAVVVMNYILGGGGFASRLMDNIRDNKGLSYDVHSFFAANKYAGSFQVGLQTKNESANTAIEETLKEMNRIMTEPVSDKELMDARSFLTGSFPLKIDSNNKIAGFLTSVEYYNLGLDYIEKYPSYINAVTKEDVMRVAKKYLNTRGFVLVVVGDPEKVKLKY